MVTKYDCELKEFTVMYQNKIIKQDVVDWFSQDGNSSEIDYVKIKMIQDRI